MNDTSQLPTGTWSLDPSTTTITITAKKLLAIEVPATLTVSSGLIEIADGQVASVDISADATSYASKNPKRNEHVVGSDFLDTVNHPVIRFHADDVTANGSDGTANGSLTVKGQTSKMAVTISNVRVDGNTATFDASASVDRRDLGVSKMPSLIIGAQLRLTVSATATLTS
ncbi:MAG: YceI family protein [Ilumatobacter sp.]